jgi:hypothetical protein
MIKQSLYTNDKFRRLLIQIEFSEILNISLHETLF